MNTPGRRGAAPPAAPRLGPLAGPLLAELVLGMAVGLVGTALAAAQSDTHAAAFALVQQVVATLFVLFRILGAGVSVVVAQELGAGRGAQAVQVARSVLGASSWMGLLAAMLTALTAPLLLAVFQAPADVRALALPLLWWMAPILLLDGWTACGASVLRAHLRTRETLGVILLMHLLALAVALWAMPRWGLAGFAVAQLVSRVLAAALLAWLWRRSLGIALSVGGAWRFSWAHLRPVLRIGLPGAAENIAWRLAFMVSVVVAAQLGTQALAVQSYVLQIMMLILLSALALGLSVEIVVGHLVGAGQLRRAHRLVKKALLLGWCLSLLLAGSAALAGPWLMRQFSGDAQLVALGAVLLWWTVLLEPGRTFNLVVINGLRAAGDARYPFVAGVGSMLVVLAGGSWLLGIGLGWGLVGVWLAYAADEWLRGLLMWRRWVSLKWVPHARAARRRRLAAARQGVSPVDLG